jgi:hyperosmotically inducible protein
MGSVIRALLVIVLVGFVAFFVLGWWTGSRTSSRPADKPAATSGTIDTATARQRGAEIGEKAAVATAKVKETVQDAALTTKIKAKMALDDSVKSRAIDVTTNDSTVTLSGTVSSAAERDRAVRLARETDGVTQVVDHLRIGR